MAEKCATAIKNEKKKQKKGKDEGGEPLLLHTLWNCVWRRSQKG